VKAEQRNRADFMSELFQAIYVVGGLGVSHSSFAGSARKFFRASKPDQYISEGLKSKICGFLKQRHM